MNWECEENGGGKWPIYPSPLPVSEKSNIEVYESRHKSRGIYGITPFPSQTPWKYSLPVCKQVSYNKGVNDWPFNQSVVLTAVHSAILINAITSCLAANQRQQWLLAGQQTVSHIASYGYIQSKTPVICHSASDPRVCRTKHRLS